VEPQLGRMRKGDSQRAKRGEGTLDLVAVVGVLGRNSVHEGAPAKKEVRGMNTVNVGQGVGSGAGSVKDLRYRDLLKRKNHHRQKPKKEGWRGGGKCKTKNTGDPS